MCLLFVLKLLDVLGQQSDLDICRIRSGSRSCKYISFASFFVFVLFCFVLFFFFMPTCFPLEYHKYAVCSFLSSRYV